MMTKEADLTAEKSPCDCTNPSRCIHAIEHAQDVAEAARLSKKPPPNRPGLCRCANPRKCIHSIPWWRRKT